MWFSLFHHSTLNLFLLCVCFFLFLLQNFQDPILHRAVESGNVEMVELLIEFHANPMQTRVQICQFTLFYYCVVFFCNNIFFFCEMITFFSLDYLLNFLKFLIFCLYNMQMLNGGESALDLAKKLGNQNIIEILQTRSVNSSKVGFLYYFNFVAGF